MAMVESKQLHIAMFPWFAMGHIIPYLHLSNELAQRGHKISFLLPNKAKSEMQHLNLHPNLIVLHPITVPPVDGLPLGSETASDVPFSLNGLLLTAFDLTHDQVQALLLNLKPDFVFFDFACWIPQLAAEIGFKTVCYQIVAAATIASGTCGGVPRPPSFELLPPGYPSSTVVLRPHEARNRWLQILSVKSGSGISFQKRLTMGMENCDVLAMRTCRELDGRMCEYIATHFGKPMLLTGPALPKLTTTMPQLEKQWVDWLNRFEPSSVVFCAFGSQWVLEKDQFQELVLAFELTGLPFIIALKPPVGAATIEKALPEGYEERIRGRGVVYGGWVQQPSILSHPSVGCFVSHCGFGSMWESLLSDNQMVLLPYMSDHILTTRLLAQDLKVAVEVERDENGWFSKESLCQAIVSVMNKDSEEAALLKKNHAKWKETLLTPGLMSGYIDEFINKLQEL